MNLGIRQTLGHGLDPVDLGKYLTPVPLSDGNSETYLEGLLRESTTDVCNTLSSGTEKQATTFKAIDAGRAAWYLCMFSDAEIGVNQSLLFS